MTTCKKEWILLCCLVVVAACQREPMGEIDPEVREVNTQFVFNIATSAAQTKQASDAVQEGSAAFPRPSSCPTPFPGTEKS